MQKARVEAVSDGVFAIAITLLVLTIGEPSNYHRLAHDLAHRWPSLAAYVVSFAVIGIMWFNHHAVFAHVARVDRTFFYCNLLLLMTVAFLPYPTGVLGQALGRHQGMRAAAVFYSVTMTVNACAWTLLWLYASTGRRLLGATFPEADRRTSTVLFSLGAVVYAATVAVGAVNAFACLAVHGALAVYYALDPLNRGSGAAASPGTAVPDTPA